MNKAAVNKIAAKYPRCRGGYGMWYYAEAFTNEAGEGHFLKVTRPNLLLSLFNLGKYKIERVEIKNYKEKENGKDDYTVEYDEIDGTRICYFSTSADNLEIVSQNVRVLFVWTIERNGK